VFAAKANKKTDVADRPKAIDYIGILFNEPPDGAGVLFI